MLIFGILALVKGEFSLTRDRVVDGWPARIIGIVLMIPMPLGFCIGFAIGVATAAQKKELNPMTLLPLDVGLVITCLLVALGIAVATAHPRRKKRRRKRPDNYEEYDEFPDDHEGE
jgi:Na+/H+-dicarboxylate symporter